MCELKKVNLHEAGQMPVSAWSLVHCYGYWYGVCHSTLAYVASSGLAATLMIIRTLKSGDHIVTMNDPYGGELLCSKTNTYPVQYPITYA